MRLRIDLAYDGTDFRGWATQPGLRTVQGELQSALATILRVESVAVVCAGRTDAGVHARGQVVHLDVDGAARPRAAGTPAQRAPAADVRVRRAAVAPEGFDARFSALRRRYAYRIADTAAALDPLTRDQVLAWPRPLDLDAMNAASALLVGRHDFASFCRQREGATTIRTLEQLSWARDEAGLWSAPSSPTPSATAWCAPSSAAWSRSVTAASRSLGRESCARRRATRA